MERRTAGFEDVPTSFRGRADGEGFVYTVRGGSPARPDNRNEADGPLMLLATALFFAIWLSSGSMIPAAGPALCGVALLMGGTLRRYEGRKRMFENELAVDRDGLWLDGRRVRWTELRDIRVSETQELVFSLRDGEISLPANWHRAADVLSFAQMLRAGLTRLGTYSDRQRVQQGRQRLESRARAGRG